MSAPSPTDPSKEPSRKRETIECDVCYGLAKKFSGNGDTVCYGFSVRRTVPKDGERDLEAVKALPPNSKSYMLGKCVYNTRMSQSGRPPLLIIGVQIANIDTSSPPMELPVPPKDLPAAGSSHQANKTPRTREEIIDDLEKSSVAMLGRLKKAVGTTSNDLARAKNAFGRSVEDLEYFYPRMKVAASKTLDELPGQLKVGIDKTGQMCGRAWDKLIAKLNNSDPKSSTGK